MNGSAEFEVAAEAYADVPDAEEELVLSESEEEESTIQSDFSSLLAELNGKNLD